MAVLADRAGCELLRYYPCLVVEIPTMDLAAEIFYSCYYTLPGSHLSKYPVEPNS